MATCPQSRGEELEGLGEMPRKAEDLNSPLRKDIFDIDDLWVIG